MGVVEPIEEEEEEEEEEFCCSLFLYRCDMISIVLSCELFLWCLRLQWLLSSVQKGC